VGQEFIIKSQGLEDKINQLLPSQGGFQAGVDLSASTQIIPIVDLTETAEGSNLRADLQVASSLTSVTTFSVANTTSTLVNTTGYFRVFGSYNGLNGSTNRNGFFELTDGTTTKKVFALNIVANNAEKTNVVTDYDFIVFLQAGDSLTATTDSTLAILIGTTRQIADINGNLVNP
jgi:hypothetical protein